MAESLLSVDFSQRLKRSMFAIFGEVSGSTAEDLSMKRMSFSADSLETLLACSDDSEEESSEVLETGAFSSSS